MRKLCVALTLLLALGLSIGCGSKKEETASKPAETKMVKDVVCGMNLDANKASLTEEYEGKTYHFCSEGCREKFVANPAQYATAEAPGKPAGGMSD